VKKKKTSYIINLCRLSLVRERSTTVYAPIREPGDVAALHRRLMGPSPACEHVLLLALDSRHKVLVAIEVARGGANSAHIPRSTCLRAALCANASALIIVHNHPSGLVDVSPEDCEMTRALKAADELVDLQLLDSVVVTTDEYASLREQGAM